MAAAATSSDGNDTRETASVLPSFDDPGQSIIVVADEVGGSDPTDWYSFTASNTGVIRIDLTELNDDLDLALFDSAGLRLEDSAQGGLGDERIFYAVEQGQTYFIEVSPWAPAGSDYTMTVKQVVEATISTQAGPNGDLVYAVDGGEGPQVIKDSSGFPVGVFGPGGWDIVEARWDGESFFLLWAHPDNGYYVWDLDAAGHITYGEEVDNLANYEKVLDVDLNGDGVLGYNVVVVEDDGDVDLNLATDGYYSIVSDAGFFQVSFDLDDPAMAALVDAGGSILHAEATDEGYRLFGVTADGVYAEAETDAGGNVINGSFAPVADVVDVEEFYQADLNGDGVIGIGATSIEEIGSHGLFGSSITGAYYIADMSSDTFVTVTQNGETVGPNTLAGWDMVQAAQNDTNDGYTVFWEEASGLRAVWELDETGAYIDGGLVDNVVDYEELFGADLNGDNLIGHFTALIEISGSYGLYYSTENAYYVAPLASDTVVTVTQNGEIVGPDTLAGWDMVQAERNATDDGYIVLWEEVSGLRAVWELDETGAYIDGALVDNVVDYELLFDADLNGDFVIGHVPNIIEQIGQYALFSSSTSGAYYVADMNSDDFAPVFRDGAFVGPDTLAGWQMVQVERNETDDGFIAFWEEASGLRAVWNLDETAAFTSGALVDNVVDYEARFGVDLNGDNQVGHRYTDIEETGSYGLASSSTVGSYLIVDMDAGDYLAVTQDGAFVSPDTLAGWEMVQAARNEADDGYTVFWEEASGLRAVWELDETGAFTGGALVDNVIDYEELFEADLNDDGEIGHVFTAIEEIGDYGLFSSTEDAYYVAHMFSAASVTVTQNGETVGPDTLAGWEMVQAARNEADDGYTVFWEEVSGLRAVWELDETGAFTGGALVDNVVDYEELFGADLNDDGEIGHVFTAIEEIGDYGLFSSTEDAYYVAHMFSAASVTVTQNGETVGPDTLAGWEMVQAARNEADDGYTVFWEGASGLRAVWELDETGAYIDGALVDNVVDYEELFGADLNDDGEIGHVFTAIEEIGDYGLFSSTEDAYYVAHMFSAASVTVTQGGETVGPDTLAGWEMVQAARNEADDGYTVFWEEVSGLRAVWELDETGAYTDGALVDDVADYEDLFGVDLNGDDVIGSDQFIF